MTVIYIKEKYISDIMTMVHFTYNFQVIYE